MEGISLYKCYSGRAFQFLQVLHCTVATHWAKTRVPLRTGPKRAGGSSSTSGAASARIKCTYDVCLHLAVGAAGVTSGPFVDGENETTAVALPLRGGIKRRRSNSIREDSQTASVGKCWCSERCKLMDCQCFIKTKVCRVLQEGRRSGFGSQSRHRLTLSLLSFKRLWSSFTRR